MESRRRPTGVTVLTGLHIIIGVVDIFIAGILLALSVLATTIAGFDVVVFGVFLLPIALLLLAFGLFSLVLAYGLWAGRGWARISSFLVAIIGLIAAAIGLALQSWVNIAALIFYSIILVYLDSANVRAFFGASGGLRFERPFKSAPKVQPSPTPVQPPNPSPSFPPPPPPNPHYQQPKPSPRQQISRQNFCPYCMNPTRPDVNFCDRCGSRLVDIEGY